MDASAEIGCTRSAFMQLSGSDFLCPGAVYRIWPGCFPASFFSVFRGVRRRLRISGRKNPPRRNPRSAGRPAKRIERAMIPWTEKSLSSHDKQLSSEIHFADGNSFRLMSDGQRQSQVCAAIRFGAADPPSIFSNRRMLYLFGQFGRHGVEGGRSWNSISKRVIRSPSSPTSACVWLRRSLISSCILTNSSYTLPNPACMSLRMLLFSQ